MTVKEQLVEIVGKDNVLDSPEVMERYGKDHSLERPTSFTCVVRPKTVEETQRVIQLANEGKFAVVPSSSGIHFHGDAIPEQGGVVLDLQQMDSIVRIIEDNTKLAHIQVGVSWEQFQNALEGKGYRAVTPLLPHASRSVIMDWLEGEQPVVQVNEYAEPLICMQVVWGNGELFATGSASASHFHSPGCLAEGVASIGPGNMSYDTFLYGSQGTMGVVTWGTVAFEEIPTLSKTLFIPADRAEDAIDPIYRILRRRIGYECLLLNNINLATILAENWPQQFTELRATLPPWTVILVLGALKRRPEERIAYEEEALREIMTAYFPTLQLLTTLPGSTAVEKRMPEMLRKPWPKDKTYWKHAYKGGCQDLIFMTTLDRVERFIPVVTEVANRLQYPTNDIGCYIQPVQHGRACELQFNFYYNPDDEAEKEKIRRLYVEAAAAVLDKGAYFTRPFPMVADMVYKKHGDYASLLKRVKKIFDPNGVLNPGKLCF